MTGFRPRNAGAAPDASGPLVSVVVPGYKPTFLGEALESALAQTYAPIEIVVSDNCPTGAVREVCERYPDVRYVRNPVTGVYPNFRNCVRLARGEYVKFLLDDDLLEPTCVEKLVRAARRYRGVTLVASRYRLVDERGRERELRGLRIDRDIVSSPGGAPGPMLAKATNPLGPLTTSLFPRAVLPLGIGPYFFTSAAPIDYFGLIDFSLLLDLAFLGRVVALAEPLSAMRQHRGQLSNAATNPNAVRSLTAWRRLAIDAHAFGLIDAAVLRESLENTLALYRRHAKSLPVLAAEIADLEQSLDEG